MTHKHTQLSRRRVFDADVPMLRFSAEAVEDGYRNEGSVGHSDSSSASGKRQCRSCRLNDFSLTAPVSRSEESQTACFI